MGKGTIVDVHGKFMKSLQRRMRRTCGIKDDSLQVTYSTHGSNITVMVIAKDGSMAGMKIFASLEEFIWALVVKETKNVQVQ